MPKSNNDNNNNEDNSKEAPMTNCNSFCCLPREFLLFVLNSNNIIVESLSEKEVSS